MFFRKSSLLRGRLERVAFDAYEAGGLVRLSVNGSQFYGKKDFFQNPGLLNDLQPGDAVYLDAHRLDGGSFWFHWLHCPARGVLESRDFRREIRWDFIIAFFLLLIILTAFAVLADDRLDAMLRPYPALVMLAALPFFLRRCYAFRSLCSISGKSAAVRREGLLSVLSRGEPGGLAPVQVSPEFFQPPAFPSIAPEDAGEIQLLSGPVRDISAAEKGISLRHGGISRSFYNAYNFTCLGRHMLWAVKRPGEAYTLSEMLLKLLRGPRLHFRRKPRFLAEGDVVTALVCSNESAGISGDYNTMAVTGLFNHCGGAAYNKNILYSSYNMIFLPALDLFFLSIMLGGPGVAAASTIVFDGFPRAAWFREAAPFMTISVCASVLVGGLIVLGAEIGARLFGAPRPQIMSPVIKKYLNWSAPIKRPLRQAGFFSHETLIGNRLKIIIPAMIAASACAAAVVIFS